jgi:hypothetical protein
LACRTTKYVILVVRIDQSLVPDKPLMSSPATTWKKISHQTHATGLIFENQENNPLPQEHCVLCNIIQTYVHKLHDICTWIHDNHFPYNHWWFGMIMSKNNLCLIPRDTRYPQFTKNKIYANIPTTCNDNFTHHYSNLCWFPW